MSSEWRHSMVLRTYITFMNVDLLSSVCVCVCVCVCANENMRRPGYEASTTVIKLKFCNNTLEVVKFKCCKCIVSFRDTERICHNIHARTVTY